MQKMFVERVIEYLAKQHFIKPDDVKLATHMVQEKFRDQDFVAWSVADVLSQAKEIGIEITENEAREILFKVIHKHDANIGIHWDIFDNYIIDYKA